MIHALIVFKNTSTTCGEPINKACDPKKDPTYLLTYVLTYAYLPT